VEWCAGEPIVGCTVTILAAARPPRGSPKGLRYRRSIVVAAAAVFVAYVAMAQQHPLIDVTVTGKAIDGAVEYSNPALRIKGTLAPSHGSRFYVVELAVGGSDVAGELDTFRLIADSGAEYVAVAAGGGANLLFPIDKLPMGREMTQILPVDGIIAVTRNSLTSVIVETTPKATLALLYEIPAGATGAGIKLPDGTSHSLK
jgi:hypothetical protein